MAKYRQQRGGTILYDTIKTASRLTKRVLVGISGGKDSTVVLDLCTRFFKEVVGFSMYTPCRLEFMEKTLRFYEKQYGIEIVRVPHYCVSDKLRYGIYRNPDLSVPLLEETDVLNYVREQTDTWWIAGGERATDNLVRNAMIKGSGTIDAKRGRIFVIAYWHADEVLHYIKMRKLKTSPEFRYLGHSLGGLDAFNMAPLKEYFPADYERICACYPYVEVSTKREEFFDFYNVGRVKIKEAIKQRMSEQNEVKDDGVRAEKDE
ncbi:MAG: phosphoadenosine phosphosulfate reductase family protein [Pyramidobacter sp.]|uniref:phosphoadenosine phosphosulfate reductase domain-containing protein n=1 Tax=Pyramidobacter sp. TaxID=1943581 RepID=UPI0025CFFC63|nr:phosphoadenosine phosphosulfate reductase family protein [Pyramidobacter sp.]MCI7403956.1 phosphoadenosine phosphosulfate reductase family protein [Pyramidobacter sp.]